MTKLRRDEEVSLTILSKICKTLNADFGDIVEYVPDAEIWDLYNENRELLGRVPDFTAFCKQTNIPVDLEPEKGQVLFTKTRKIIDGGIYNDIMDVWLFEYDGEVDLSNTATDEVAQITWMSREQIKELFEYNLFVETLEYFFESGCYALYFCGEVFVNVVQ